LNREIKSTNAAQRQLQIRKRSGTARVTIRRVILLATLPFQIVVTRLGLALVAGFIIGLERELRGRSAGLRTTMLACFSAAATMILAENLFDDPLTHSAAKHDAISRVIQGVVTGIGFLGAGAITREERHIYGLTTAAVLWSVTVLGMIFGAGHWGVGIAGVALTMFILVGLRLAEQFLPRDRFGHLAVTTHMSGATDAELRDRIVALGAAPEHFSMEYDLENKQRTLRCDIRYRRPDPFQTVEHLVSGLSQCRGVVTVDWQSG
jgi:putative Mg2+ transporter-C (MgtC) family protein